MCLRGRSRSDLPRPADPHAPRHGRPSSRVQRGVGRSLDPAPWYALAWQTTNPCCSWVSGRAQDMSARSNHQQTRLRKPDERPSLLAVECAPAGGNRLDTDGPGPKAPFESLAHTVCLREAVSAFAHEPRANWPGDDCTSCSLGQSDELD